MARADEWIKIRVSLPDDPRVRKIARETRLPIAHVVGLLVLMWVYADEHAEETSNGHGKIIEMLPKDFDSMIGRRGMHKHMPDDWVRFEGTSTIFVNYCQHNGSTAKTRAQATKRQQKHRSKT